MTYPSSYGSTIAQRTAIPSAGTRSMESDCCS